MLSTTASFNSFFSSSVFRGVVMGHRGPLQLSDLCKLYNEESVHTLSSVFEHEWDKQQNYNEVTVKIHNNSQGQTPLLYLFSL